jgi:hypothetical protein
MDEDSEELDNGNYEEAHYVKSFRVYGVRARAAGSRPCARRRRRSRRRR